LSEAESQRHFIDNEDYGPIDNDYPMGNQEYGQSMSIYSNYFTNNIIIQDNDHVMDGWFI